MSLPLKNTVVHCKTEEENNAVIEYLLEQGWRVFGQEASPSKYRNGIGRGLYGAFKEKQSEYSDIEYYQDGAYRILCFNEFLQEVVGKNSGVSWVKDPVKYRKGQCWYTKESVYLPNSEERVFTYEEFKRLAKTVRSLEASYRNNFPDVA